MGTGRVIGIGGVFLKAKNRNELSSWYAQNLGIAQDSMFKWRSIDPPEAEHMTVWSRFPQESTYFDPSAAPFMTNYIVDDLDPILDKLRSNEVKHTEVCATYSRGTGFSL